MVRFSIPADWKTRMFKVQIILAVTVVPAILYIISITEGPHIYFLIAVSTPPQGYIIFFAVLGEIVYLGLLNWDILPLRETAEQKLNHEVNLTNYYIKQEGKQRRKYESALHFISQKELLDEFQPLLVRLREWEEKRSNVRN